MPRAVWNGVVIAESPRVQTVDGYTYFPPESVRRELLRSSATSSTCPWKGQASYFSVVVDGNELPDAAWVYKDPKPAARHIQGHVGFWRGVEVQP